MEVMSKQVIYILILVGLLSSVACTNENNPMYISGIGEIRFSVIDTTEVGVTTRASLDFNVDDFSVSLSKGDISIFSNKRYGDIAGTTIACAASPDYLLTAESCTEADAESANEGWGQARVSGKQTFAVAEHESKTVTVNCGLTTSSVNVEFSDFVASMFTTYSINLYAVDATNRTITFNESNYSSNTAYFNVGESGRKLAYTVNLPSPYKPYSGTLTLEPAKNYNLSVKIQNEGTGTTATLSIKVDGTLFEEQILPEKINPYE